MITKSKFLATFTIASLSLVLLLASPGLIGAGQDTMLVLVIGVSSGDSIGVIDQEDQQHRVRLLGIAAPRRGDPLFDASRNHLDELIYNRSITIYPAGTGIDGRIAAKLVLNSNDICLAQIKAGFASHLAADAAKQEAADRTLYDEAQAQARAAGLGIWKVPPAPAATPAH